jgi:hypothetical protein
MRPFYRAIPTVCMALVNIGLQVSGYTNFGLACVLWAIAGALALWGAGPWIAELWPKTILAVDGQPKQREQDFPPTQITKASPPIERDVWLRDAMWRAFLRTWHVPDGGIVPLPVGESENQRFAMLIIEEFRQSAFEGKLPIWGRRKGSFIWEPIPSDFWAHNHIDHVLVMSADPREDIKAMPENPWNKPDTSGDWRHFMTSKAVIERLYPRPQ